MRNEKEIKNRIEDINPRVPFSQLISKDSQFKLEPDVQKSAEIALAVLENENIVADEVLGSYLTGKGGIITNLEIHNLPPDVAWKIHEKLCAKNIGGYINSSGDNADIALPRPVNVFRTTR